MKLLIRIVGVEPDIVCYSEYRVIFGFENLGAPISVVRVKGCSVLATLLLVI
jgi:hypothetical protein